MTCLDELARKHLQATILRPALLSFWLVRQIVTDAKTT
jgi:hypothetical protein